MSSPTVKPAITAILDPKFLPPVLFNRNYVVSARASGQAVPLVLGLEREFPEIDIAMRVPDEKTRRVGQAVAAASLPKIKK